jgi:hypothetical protein
VTAKPQNRLFAPWRPRVNDPLTKTTNLPLFLKSFDKVPSSRRRHLARLSPQRKTDSPNRRTCLANRTATRMTTMTGLTGKIGFASPTSEKAFAKQRRAGVELFATVALAICLMIAATAVSIGMASAHAPLMQILYRS